MCTERIVDMCRYSYIIWIILACIQLWCLVHVAWLSVNSVCRCMLSVNSVCLCMLRDWVLILCVGACWVLILCVGACCVIECLFCVSVHVGWLSVNSVCRCMLSVNSVCRCMLGDWVFILWQKWWDFYSDMTHSTTILSIFACSLIIFWSRVVYIIFVKLYTQTQTQRGPHLED